MDMRGDEPDVIDLGEVAGVVWRQRLYVVAGAIIGCLAGLVVTFVMNRTYEGEATVLLQAADASSSFALPGLGDLGTLGGVLGGMPSAAFDTEIQLLTSRAVVGEVVDSLALQAEVAEPRGLAATAVVTAVRTPPRYVGGAVDGRREGAIYRISDESGAVEVMPGAVAGLPSGVELQLASGPLPDEFQLRVSGRDAAIARVQKKLSHEEPGGEIVRLVYEAGSAEAAAAVPNAIVARYLARRRGQDRGVNQRRYEFLVEKTDSVARELAAAEGALRSFQEQSGVLDPEVRGRVDLERAMELESELETLQIEAQTLREIVAAASSGDIPVRSLAAYPTFLRNAAINTLLEQLLTFESERTQLRQRRTMADPEVVALTESISLLEEQLASLSRSYLTAVERQIAAIGAELSRHRESLGTLPASAEQSYRRQRDVRLLSEMLTALQAQQLQARLGTISEGGDVRLVDAATVPLRPSSPRLLLNLLVGLAAGLFLGVLVAFGRGYFGNRVDGEADAELATGLPVARLRAGAPLFLSRGSGGAGVLILPVGSGGNSGEVARRLAGTASLQGERVALALWSGAQAALHAGHGDEEAPERGEGVPTPTVIEHHADGGSPGSMRDTLSDLEDRADTVFVALPPIGTPVTTAVLSPHRSAVLVAAAGGVGRRELRDARVLLERLGVTILGVVLTESSGNGR